MYTYRQLAVIGRQTLIIASLSICPVLSPQIIYTQSNKVDVIMFSHLK